METQEIPEFPFAFILKGGDFSPPFWKNYRAALSALVTDTR